MVAARDGVERVRPEASTDAEIVEEAGRHDPLLDGTVGQATAGDGRDRPAPTSRPTRVQEIDVPVDVSGVRLDDARGIVCGERTQEVVEVAGVGVEGLGALLPLGARLDEGAGGGVSGHAGVLGPRDSVHNHAPPLYEHASPGRCSHDHKQRHMPDIQRTALKDKG